MANLASLEVYASPADIVELLRGGQRPTAVTDAGATEITFTDEGIASVDSLVENGNVMVVADTSADSNAFARVLFTELTENSPWRVTLLDADTCEVIGERPAIRAVS